MEPAPRRLRLAAVSIAVAVTACGGGGGSSEPRSARASYAIGGTLTGLPEGMKLTVQNVGQDADVLDHNGPFTLSAGVPAGSSYDVTVAAAPPWQSCEVSSGSGNAAASVTDIRISCTNAMGEVSTFAGDGIAGFADGAPGLAMFKSPNGLTMSSDGDLYVGDSENSVIRVIAPNGDVSTFAGHPATRGLVPGVGQNALIGSPNGVAFDGSGNLYVADNLDNVIWKISSAAAVTVLAGTGHLGRQNGTGSAAAFSLPAAVAVDAAGTIYVADTNNNVIRKITPAGVVSDFVGSGQSGSADGVGAAASFGLPAGLAFDRDGNLLVADTGNNLIRKVTPGGQVTTLAGSGLSGSADGAGSAASFSFPRGIYCDASGNIFIVDSGSGLIRKIVPPDLVSTLAGSGNAGLVNGLGAAASFSLPISIAADRAGNLYVSDEGNNVIRKISAHP